MPNAKMSKGRRFVIGIWSFISHSDLGFSHLASASSRLPNLTGFGFYRRHGIARVHDARRPVGQFLVIDCLMIGCDDDRVETFERLPVPVHRTGARPMRMLAGRADDRHIGIIIGRFSPAFLQQIHQRVTRRFPLVVHIRLVGQANHQHPAAVHRLAPCI